MNESIKETATESKLRVMIVDDEELHLRSVNKALKLNSYDPMPYQDPVKALDEYDKDKVDVVITDFRMPGMTGIELLKGIKRKHADAYVIIMTGYADKDNAIDAVNNGAYFFFRKPIDIRLLLDTLTKIEKELEKKRKEAMLVKLALEYQRVEKILKNLKEIGEHE